MARRKTSRGYQLTRNAEEKAVQKDLDRALASMNKAADTFWKKVLEADEIKQKCGYLSLMNPGEEVQSAMLARIRAAAQASAAYGQAVAYGQAARLLGHKASRHSDGWDFIEVEEPENGVSFNHLDRVVSALKPDTYIVMERLRAHRVEKAREKAGPDWEETDDWYF